METKTQPNRWLPITFVVWNLIDIAVHIAVDMVEVLRISGNVLGIAVAVVVLTGLTKNRAHDLLAGSALIVITLNSVFAAQVGVIIPMLVFVGVSVVLMFRWAQVKRLERERFLADGHGVKLRFYHRWWTALAATLLGTLVVVLAGLAAS